MFFISFVKHYSRLVPKCFFLEMYDLSRFTKENNSGLNLLIPLSVLPFVATWEGKQSK